MPFVGAKTKDLGSNIIGISVFDDGENLKFVRSLIRPTFVCISPKRSPMHWKLMNEFSIWFSKVYQLTFLGPSPNGRKAIACRFFLFSSENRSGSNFSGSE